MPIMAETGSVDGSVYVAGISAGCLYSLECNTGACVQATLSGISDSDGQMRAFCCAADHAFAAVGSKVFRYAITADGFDPSILADTAFIASADVGADVVDLAYSGTDTTFDMRIYA